MTQVAAPAQKSTVVITATILADGSKRVHEMPMTHAQGTQDSQLFGQAIGLIRQMGGLMFDCDNGDLEFYPLSSMKLHLSIRKISLAVGGITIS